MHGLNGEFRPAGRRSFIIGALSASIGIGSARAQKFSKPQRIGWIGIGAQASEYLAAMRRGLHNLGYAEGEDLLIEARWPTEFRDRVPELLRELVDRDVRLIVAQGPIVPMMRHHNIPVPLLFAYSGDPVEAGLVESIARPGGNLTGTSFMSYEVNAKRLELLHECLPTIRRVAILSNPQHPGEPRELRETLQGARKLGIETSYTIVRSAQEVEPALEKIRAARAQAVIVLPDAFLMSHRQRIIAFASAERLPTVSGWAIFAKSGGTMTYGPNLNASFERLAVYVDKILNGAKPADLPVEQPRTFELVLNLKNAKELGLAIPPSVLVRANDVIE